MKKNTKIIILTIVLILLMGLYKPLISLLLPDIDKGLSGLIRKLLQAITIIIYISKLKWWNNIGCISKISKKSLYLLLPVIILSFMPIMNGLKVNSSYKIIILLMTSILIGMTEEFEYRGIIFSALIDNGKKSAIIISAIIFALAHFLNLTAGADFLDTLVQVVFAFGFGLIMAVTRYKTNLLLPQILVHALWDFNANVADTNFLRAIDLIHTVSLGIIVLFGVFLYRFTKAN